MNLYLGAIGFDLNTTPITLRNMNIYVFDERTETLC